MSAHLREWDLRRLFAGELETARQAEVWAHLSQCEACRGLEHALEEERRQFEVALPFDRFAEGVERKQRAVRKPSPMTRWVQGAVALAACATLAVLAPNLIARHGGLPGAGEGPAHAGNRLKGGAEVELRIGVGNGGPQRVAGTAEEALGPGERVRIGYRPGPHGYLAAISVDEHGAVSPLYPESGQSLPVAASPQLAYLPGSLEFTGQGREKVFVVLSDAPLEVSQLEGAAKAAFARAGGDLARVGPLDVPGEQFQRTLLKP